MGVAGLVLGIVAVSLWLAHRRRMKQVSLTVNAHAAILQQVIDEMNNRTAEQNERFETPLGRLNDLQSLLDTTIRVKNVHSDQIINMLNRIESLEQIQTHRSFTAESDHSEPTDGPLYVAMRYERHHTKRPSGEVGKMPVFSSLELLQAKYGPNCGYKRLDLPEGGQ